MRKRNSPDSHVLELLKKDVERYVSFPINTPDDFSRLAEAIKTSGNAYVSATTLKRVWGYISDTGEDYRPSSYTIRALCNFIGFRDLNEFTQSSATIQSREFTGSFLESRNLEPDAEIELRWQPNRRCLLRHKKECLFEVVSSENSRLEKGDYVECGCFTQHAPAYFSRVYRNGASPKTYIAGTSNGVVFTLFPLKDS